MSGGSFDYLHSRAPDDLRSLVDDFTAMADELSGAFPGVARRTRDIARALEVAAVEAEALADVWHAAEWYRSGDYSRAQVRTAAIAAGEVMPPCTHPETRDGWDKDGRATWCEDCGAEVGRVKS